jgi:hypothetical protein
VAKDVIDYRAGLREDATGPWAKLFEDIIARAENNDQQAWTADALALDARYNGFGPYQIAWTLYQGTGRFSRCYAVAIRGTVFAAAPSVLEDAELHPVSAMHFLSRVVSFSDDARAALHSGFAHGTFTLLLDRRYGILQAITRLVPPGSRLYVVGHSQGAAMATLTHAFLHYALRDASEEANPFDMLDKHYTLKSYAFAQPKPGDAVFAAGFARITQAADNAIVINNDLDPVPQVPLTMQDLSDLSGDIPGATLGARLFHHLAGIGSAVRCGVARVMEYFTKAGDVGFGYYFNHLRLGSLTRDEVASSWNFTPAGHVTMVFGTQGDGSDTFLQHHAWYYRELIRQQLGTG